MADFTALKTAIQNAIKQNGNEEITGNLLQEVLLAIVTTLGDGSINDLVTALGSEATTRAQADGTLQQNINAEAQARQLADSTLQGGINTVSAAITAINNAIANGCVYAGIATPSSTPASGKVFYLALTAGTYTNYGGLEVPQGINILKNNGSTWSLDSFLGIDNAPTPSSNILVKSGGVFDKVMTDGSAFDISAHFASGGTLATYANLSAALTALDTLSASYKKGGMSIKFVQSSDNKYVRYRLMADSFSTTETDWQGVEDEPIAYSNNLVKSSGVAEINLYLGKQSNITSNVILYKGYIAKNGTITAYDTWYYGVILLKANHKIVVDNTDIGAYPSLGIASTGDVGIGDTVTVLSGKTYTSESDTWIVISAGTHLNSVIISSNDNIFNDADDEPTFGSNNLVKSGGVYPIKQITDSFDFTCDSFVNGKYVDNNGEIQSATNFYISKPILLPMLCIETAAIESFSRNPYQIAFFNNYECASSGFISINLYSNGLRIPDGTKAFIAVYYKVGGQSEGTITYKIKSWDNNVVDISMYNLNNNQPQVYNSLTDALTAIPLYAKIPGVTVKFLQLVGSNYTVVKNDGLTEAPTGATLLDNEPDVESGIYKASELSVFPSVPTELNTSVLYYIAVAEDTTTYTSWKVTKSTNDFNKYVQYRLTHSAWTTEESYWQALNVVDTDYILEKLLSLRQWQDEDGSLKGYISASGEHSRYNENEWSTVYKKVFTGDTIKFVGAISGNYRAGFTVSKPTNGFTLDLIIPTDTASTFICPTNGYFCVSNYLAEGLSLEVFTLGTNLGEALELTKFIPEVVDALKTWVSYDGYVNGFINVNGQNVRYTETTWRTLYKKVEKGEEIRFAGQVSGNYRAGFTTQVPVAGFTLSTIISTDTTSPYIAEQSGYFCISHINNGSLSLESFILDTNFGSNVSANIELLKQDITTINNDLNTTVRLANDKKKILYIGDSISTFGYYWQNFIFQDYGLAYESHKQSMPPAVGGIRLRPRNPEVTDLESIWWRCAEHRLLNAGYTPSIISIFGGTNDISSTDNNMPIGTAEDIPYVDNSSDFTQETTDVYSDDVTFCSALKGCILMIRRDFSNAEIVIPTLLYSSRGNYIPTGETLTASELISIRQVEIAQLYNLRFIPWYWSERKENTLSVFSKDTVHPSKAGARVMARWFADYMPL